MSTRPVQSHAPSASPASLDPAADSPAASQAPRAHDANATHRGPDVIVDHRAPSNASRRLQVMQQRVHSRAEPSPTASREARYAAMVTSYRNLMLAGLTPAAPPAAPALPSMSSDELIARCHVPVPDFHAALRSAEHAAETNRPWGAQEQFFGLVGRSIEAHTGLNREHGALGSEALTHAAIEGAVLPHELAELVVEFSPELVAHGGLAAGVSALATAVAIVDAGSQFVQEMILIGQGRYRPTPAVLHAMREAIPRMEHTWRERTGELLQRSFSAGVQRAAQGLPPDPTRASDPAYAMGTQRGETYRREHGDAHTRVMDHNGAMTQARREAAHASPRVAGPSQRFVPVSQLEPRTVGAEIHLDP